VTITSDFATLPYEAGWATEAVFFTQVEGSHPALTITTEVSPDGIHWLPRGETQKIAEDESLADSVLTVFGNWIRVSISGATENRPARVLIHLSLKG
jgi:hypothetical protein